MRATDSEPVVETTAASFAAVLDAVAGRENVDPELARRIGEVREYLDREPEPGRPFMTVLLRTQGTRLEPLKDALLCLQGQTDGDFEVVLLVHDAAPEAAEAVRRIVERQPPRMRERVRVAEVEGGYRARPLNAGLELAEGRYIAVFDDDDLLFAHWVETFRAAALPGRMVRALVANQEVRPEEWSGGRDGFRSLSWPKAEYPDSFDQIAHLLVNYSPFMSWAFPRELFALYGLRFDEELAVCEDWDVILRGSLLVGVDDALELTATYRRWQRGASSYSIHSSDEWRESERRVIDRIDRSVILLPPGSMSDARRLVGHALVLDAHRHLFRGNELRPPFNHVMKAAAPSIRRLVRVRDRLRARAASRAPRED